MEVYNRVLLTKQMMQSLKSKSWFYESQITSNSLLIASVLDCFASIHLREVNMKSSLNMRKWYILLKFTQGHNKKGAVIADSSIIYLSYARIL